MCLAVPGKVLEVSGDDALQRRGRVQFGTTTREVSLAYVPDVVPGEYVIVHVGFAIGRIDEAEANRVFEYLDRIGDDNTVDEKPPVGDGSAGS